MMKRNLIVGGFAIVLCVCSLATAVAAPFGSSSDPRDYLVMGRDLSHWSVGIYAEQLDRDVTYGNRDTTMSQNRTVGRIGYNVAPWWTIYGVAGSRKTELGDSGNSDAKTDLGLGMSFNLVDNQILDATLLENTIRVNAAVEVVKAQAEWGRITEDWVELSASLLLSVVNEMEGNVLFMPYSISLFGGPAYSNIEGDNIDEDSAFGLIIGIEFFYSEGVSLSVAAESFEDSGVYGGLSLRF